MRVGFIGLGDQGRPIAERLLAAGLETTVFDLDPGPVRALVEAGAAAAATAREVAERSQVVGICVPEDDHVRAVVRGAEGRWPAPGAGCVLAVHSTVLPETVIALGREAAAREVALLDACVTGGAARAAKGELTYLVGGSPEALERIRPVLECSAERIIHAGELGCGAKLKLCLNLVTYIQWAAALESFELARAAGLPPEILEEAGAANGQITPLMRAYLALHKAPEEARRSEGMQRAMRGYAGLAAKDLAWALSLARDAGVALPVGALVSQMTERLYGVEGDVQE